MRQILHKASLSYMTDRFPEPHGLLKSTSTISPISAFSNHEKSNDGPTRDSMTDSMKAIRSQEGHTAGVVDHPIPTLRPSYLLIEVKAVALNPVDYKLIDYMGEPDRTLGVEVAGEVIEVGSTVTAGFRPGDRVMAITHGSNSEEKDDGAYAEYAVVKGDIAIAIPDWMSYEEASGVPMGAFTAALGLYQQWGLPEPFEAQPEGSKRAVLIYGASSATGLYCIKLAVL
jgi:NADPH:quinone reductase-like Zn-dependent oxidoreductase